MKLILITASVVAFTQPAFATIRSVAPQEAASIFGGRASKHCVTLQPQEDALSCFTFSPPCNAESHCWDHLDQDCVSGPPQNCDGASTYLNYSTTCRLCIQSGQSCVPNGDTHSGDAVQMCYEE